jgi:hypothetical protein
MDVKLISAPTDNPIQGRQVQQRKAQVDTRVPSAGGAISASRRESSAAVLRQISEGTLDGGTPHAREDDGYDFCFVLNADKTGVGVDEAGKSICNHLADNGFDLYLYRGLDPEDIFVLIRVPLKILRDYAEYIEFRMLLDEQCLQQVLATKFEKPILINDDPKYCSFRPCEYIYARYVNDSSKVSESLYWRPPNNTSPFRNMTRLTLIGTLLEISRAGGQPLKLQRRIREGKIKACFPLHDEYEGELLKKQWFNIRKRIWLQDLFPLKEYFGEKIGLYFRFVQHYTHWLLILALLGIPLQLYEFIADDYSVPFLPIFSFLVAIWNVMMLEHWKRSEKKIALKWGSVGFEATETSRSEFRPSNNIRSYIDGTEGYKYFDPSRRSRYINQSNVLVLLMILLAIGVVASIYVIRSKLLDIVDQGIVGVVVGIINAIQIYIFNYLYGIAATALAERENHRTETEFEDSLIGKFFSFQVSVFFISILISLNLFYHYCFSPLILKFVNSYSSFFYIAFVAAHMPRPDGASENEAGECGGKFNPFIEYDYLAACIFFTSNYFSNRCRLYVFSCYKSGVNFWYTDSRWKSSQVSLTLFAV